MKTKIFTFLVVLLGGLFMATSAFAANETNVSLQVAYTYSVTSTSGMVYDWKVYKDAASTQLAVNGTDYSATFSTSSNTASITWKVAGDYYVWVQGTDNKGCYTEPKSLKVTTVTETYCLSNQTNNTTCSLIDAGTGNHTSSNADNFTFDVTISHPSTSGTYTINYTVGALTGSKTVTGVVAGTDKSATITVSHSELINEFTNNDSNDKTVAISVSSVSNSSSVNVAECTTHYTFPGVKVLAKPVIIFQ